MQSVGVGVADQGGVEILEGLISHCADEGEGDLFNGETILQEIADVVDGQVIKSINESGIVERRSVAVSSISVKAWLLDLVSLVGTWEGFTLTLECTLAARSQRCPRESLELLIIDLRREQ